MQTKTTLTIAVVAVAMIFAVMPSLSDSASAKITHTTTCTNHGGHTSTGPCTGNTDKNGKTESCVATNPAGKAPPGQNPC
jgi:hypothetical protein